MKSKLSVAWKPFLAITFWGLSFIATKSLLTFLQPLDIINLRLLLAIPLLAITAHFTGKAFFLEKSQAGWIILLALISVVHLAIQVTGMQFTSASHTGWIIGTAPIFIVILSRIFFKEKLSIRAAIGIVISLAGLILLISRGNVENLSFSGGIGDLMVLGSCVTWGFFTIVSKKTSLNCPPVISTFYVFACMLLITLPFSFHTSALKAVMHLPLYAWGSVLFLGLFCSGVAYVLWATALSESGSINTAVYLYIEPFVTLFGAWYFLGEQIPAFAIISGLVIMLGVALVNFE